MKSRRCRHAGRVRCLRVALDGEHLDRGQAAAQRGSAQRLDAKIRSRTHTAQEISRDQQRPPDLLAKLLKPCRHVERIAEERDLPMRIAAFADHHRPGMKRCPKLRNRAEPLLVGRRVCSNPVRNGKEAVDARCCRTKP